MAASLRDAEEGALCAPAAVMAASLRDAEEGALCATAEKIGSGRSAQYK
jgi:hypothetical protein